MTGTLVKISPMYCSPTAVIDEVQARFTGTTPASAGRKSSSSMNIACELNGVSIICFPMMLPLMFVATWHVVVIGELLVRAKPSRTPEVE